MIRLVFLGCGRIARAHAQRLRAHRAAVQIGFASRERARAEAFAAELGGFSAGTYEEALAAKDVDAVAVVTPPASHLELTLQALAAGKDVVLEKPPLPRSTDVAAVQDAARARGKRVFVAENYQYKPLLGRLRGLLADGLIGDVLFVHVNAIKRQAARAGDWRAEPGLALGGALYEGGIHWISFLDSLGMSMTEIQGMRPRGEGPVERSMLVAFTYAEGAVGTLSYSWEVPSLAGGLRLSKIYGRAGSITFETSGLWVLLHGKKTRLYVPGLRDLSGYRAMWADFVHAWTTGAEPVMTLDRARRDLEIIERAYATAGVA